MELPGGREGMTIEEISGVVGFGGEVEMEVGPITQALFWLRTLIGRILRWDEAKELVGSVSFISHLNEEDRARSLIVPGKPAGISRILYQFENETHGADLFAAEMDHLPSDAERRQAEVGEDIS